MYGDRRIQAVYMGLAILALGLAASATAGDWPQFRYDAGRSAASAEELPAELGLQWVQENPPPRPAFPTELRFGYDLSYEPVVLGKMMFVPSMVTDSVAALDTDTGAERWRFFADGPVRFAPVASQGKVYFVSDDGHLYCLDAEDGKLLWKFRGLPADRQDRKLMGNGRLISLWPARGGPVLEDGVIYFAAGIWSSTGIFIHALDPATGQVVWSNVTSHRIEGANLDHGVRSTVGLTPHGYLAVVGEKLVIPCGAQLPAFLDRKTGKLLPYTMGWGGRVGLAKGSWFLAGTGNYLLSSGDLYDVSRPNDEGFKGAPGRSDFKHLLYPGGFTRLQIEPTNQKALGQFRQPVLTSDVMFCSTFDGGIAAYDLAKPEMEKRTAANNPNYRRSDQYPDRWRAALTQLWRADSKLQVHIKAGSRLYAGGPGVVEAIDIPAQAGEPKSSWRAEIEGTPQRMLAADGKLFVVTQQGRIYAFGEKSGAKATVHQPPQSASAAKADAWTQTAADVLKETKVSDGYALVLGAGTGRLAEELVRQSQLTVIVVDSDPQKVAALRRRFYQAGIYGTRIAVAAGDPLSYPFSPYLASLIVSEDLPGVADSLDRALAEKVFHPLRPYGGTACLAIPAAEQGAFIEKLSDWKPAGNEIRRAGDMLLLSRCGPLPGSSDWSHEGANAANTAASEDRFLKAPLGLLWFDGSVRWHRKPGAALVRVAGGRVLIRAEKLLAADVYTGRHLWETALPSFGDLVAVDDAIFAACGKACLVLDPATGGRLRQIKLPEQLGSKPAGNLSRIRVTGDLLVGISGANLVCINHRSGEMLWSFPTRHGRLSMALGAGKVFCAELPPPANRRGQPPTQRESRMLAVDVETGELLWEHPRGAPLHYSKPHDLLVTPAGVFQGKDGRRLRDSSSAWCIAGDQWISGGLEDLQTYDLLTGAKTGKPMQWFRRGCTTLRASVEMVTTRCGGNLAYIDLPTRQITPVWNVRCACNNNLIPANGVLNAPNLTGGCTCNYMPTSLALVPTAVLERSATLAARAE